MAGPESACVVTGASSGLGRAVARAFGAAGYHVVLVGRRERTLATVADELRRGSATATPVVCDVAQVEGIACLRQALDALGRPLAVAVLNAGQTTGAGFLEPDATLEQWREMVLTNVFGVAATARVVLPHLVESRGCLLLTGSVVGRSIVPGDLYSVTKHAVSAMAEALRLEVQDRGVMVGVVQPGLMDTPMVAGPRRAYPMMDPDDVAEQLVRFSGAKRRVDLQELVLRPRPPQKSKRDKEPPA